MVESINANISEISFIKKVEGVYQEGSLDGSDVLKGLIITMDDPVQTQLHVSVFQGKFKVQLYQLESIKVQTKYAENE
jgi:hypothetical protein